MRKIKHQKIKSEHKKKKAKIRSKILKMAHDVLHNNIPQLFRPMFQPVTAKKAKRLIGKAAVRKITHHK